MTADQKQLPVNNFDEPAHRWRHYLEYKDSGVRMLGEVPEHWEVKKLKSICYMKGRIGWQGLKQSEFSTEGPYLITGMNFKDGVIRWEEVYHITEERYNEAPEIQLKVDDVLMTKDGTIGKLLYVDFLPDKASLNSHLLVLRPSKESFLPKYLYFLLQSDAFKVHIELYKTGTTFFGITQEAVSIFKMILPSINEQYTIATFLDRQTAHLDKLISKKERLIALLEEKRVALISSAVRKGFDPNAPMKDSGVEWLGEVPAHWNVKRLKYIAPVSNKKLNEKPDELLYLGLEQVESKTGRLLLDTPVENVESIVSVFEKGDVLFGKLRPYLSKVVYAEFNGVCTSELLVLKPNSASYGKFLFYQLISDDFINLINSKTYGTKMPRASSEQISNNYVPYPNLHEQRAITSFLDRETAGIDALISKVREGIEKLHEYRTALISAAVTGKIDMREEINR